MPRSTRAKLCIAASVIYGWVALPVAALAESPGRLHMFLDDAMIESSQDTKLVVQQPTRLGRPVIAADFPWQANPYTYGSVIYDERADLQSMVGESLSTGQKSVASGR